MSVLYLGSELQCLAARLADVLREDEPHRDFFAPITLIVPNRYLRKWLRLWLARHTGIAINLHFVELEDALWELLRAVDPRATQARPSRSMKTPIACWYCPCCWRIASRIWPCCAVICSCTGRC